MSNIKNPRPGERLIGAVLFYLNNYYFVLRKLKTIVPNLCMHLLGK